MKTMWKLLAAILVVCLIGGLITWSVLLGTICSEPRTPIAATNHIVQYNCHGAIVYITPFQNRLLEWLVPIMLLAMVSLNAVRKRI